MTGAADERIARLGDLLRAAPALPPPPDFVFSRKTPYFPPLGAAWAGPFFFFAVKHLYGLWDEDGRRFLGPARGHVDGRSWEGEEFLWAATARAVREEPGCLLASAQAALTTEALARLWRDDGGTCPVPLLQSHAALARAYGEALQALKTSPNKMLDEARRSARPALRLVEVLSDVPGYREDPLKRKAFLLAFILCRRPERFLQDAGEGWPPVLDRHQLRLALRWGAVEPPGAEARRALEERRTLPPAAEESVRLAAYGAFARILESSGRSVPETFALFDGARAYCPEDRPPDCGGCFFEPACAKRTELFPPAVRTLHY